MRTNISSKAICSTRRRAQKSGCGEFERLTASAPHTAMPRGVRGNKRAAESESEDFSDNSSEGSADSANPEADVSAPHSLRKKFKFLFAIFLIPDICFSFFLKVWKRWQEGGCSGEASGTFSPSSTGIAERQIPHCKARKGGGQLRGR